MKNFSFISVLVSIMLLTGCATTQQSECETVRINEFFEKSFRALLDRKPTFDTYLGGKKNYGKLDDATEVGARRNLEITRKELRELKTFDFEALDEQAKISYRIFQYLGERHIKNFKYRLHSYPLNQMFGAQSEVPSFMMNMHRVDNVADAKAYISRLLEFKRYFSEIVEGVKLRAKAGVIPPRFIFAKVIRDTGNVISGAPFDGKKDSPLFDDFKKKVGKLKISKQEKNTLIESGRQALVDAVKPAFQEVIAFMKKLEKKAPREAGATRLPNGEDFYKLCLLHHTSTNLTAGEIHQTGFAEVKRIHSEMKKVISRVAFKGNLKAFFKYMRSSKKFRFPQSAEGQKRYLDRSVEIIETMKTRLDKLFNIRAKAGLIVKAVESYREKSAGLAFYEGPSEDGKRPGTYYVNLSNMKAANSYEMEALAYHEGIPGHHMQVSISSELKNLPRFRRYTWMTAYEEGWALYSEMIPKAVGAYEDPYSDFGRLAMELRRAVRLVVDTGLHDKGWTRKKTIKYIMNNTPTVQESARKAVERYLIMPGQATAYKVGMLKILELRKKSQTALGGKFDIRFFHDEILRNGALPLTMLEEQIDAWVAKSMPAPLSDKSLY